MRPRQKGSNLLIPNGHLRPPLQIAMIHMQRRIKVFPEFESPFRVFSWDRSRRVIVVLRLVRVRILLSGLNHFGGDSVFNVA